MTLVRPKKRFLFGGAGALLALAAIAILVLTQVQSGSATHVVGSPAHAVNQYSAKFLCGPIFGPADPFSPLAPGMYNTAINIHNPNDFQVTIQKKAVISVPERNGPPFGVPSARETELLDADGSMEIDCSDVALLLNGAAGGGAVPPCGTVPTPPPPPPVWGTDFCKGYVVIEAARIILANPPAVPNPSGVPAQLDVTDILTVKEEDGIWKDYTFRLYCNPNPPQQCPNMNTLIFSSLTGTYANGGLVDLNLPARPPIPPCYNDFNPIVAPCEPYTADREIRSGLFNYCNSVGGLNCVNFFLPPPQLYVEFKEADFATDSRDVSLDFEFVNPKVVRYNCWPKGNQYLPGCP